jgi:hypothetical protein
MRTVFSSNASRARVASRSASKGSGVPPGREKVPSSCSGHRSNRMGLAMTRARNRRPRRGWHGFPLQLGQDLAGDPFEPLWRDRVHELDACIDA